MPTYSASMSLGHTITDPIENGILSEAASIALFEHFMIEMNAKWEYVLDPHFDTHNNVRRRSPLLFATVLFCSSKFANYQDGELSLKTDPFLQSRLCSLARNLAVRTFAEGDRSIETMQAFYLLVCWKDADDDISYLHSGYAFQILHDLDLEQSNGNAQQTARRRRAWLALFRQDKQQSMFFMRRASLNIGDEEDSPRLFDLQTWLKMPHSLPLDFVACCSADLRRIQSKIRVMIPKASSTMLPCLSDLLDSELNRWKLTWQPHFDGKGRLHQNDDLSLDQRMLYSGQDHLSALVGVWEHSVRLNISSSILKQALMASVNKDSRASELPSAPASSLGFPAMGEELSTDTPGLASSVHGALGTLRQLLKFPTDDLRRAPDALTLLAPNTALFLCLLLCLPCDGILGPSFQRTAVSLIKDITRHVKDMGQSPQDMVNLHAAYLESLANLLQPMTPQRSPTLQGHMRSGIQHLGLDGDQMLLEETELQAAQVLAGGMDAFHHSADINNALLGFTSEPEQVLHMQSFANLMDTSFFWDAPPMTTEKNYD
ncbi:Protein priB [Colletotrichum tropicale]|nr:Protein priB [Colletotrichum tropicale]